MRKRLYLDSLSRRVTRTVKTLKLRAIVTAESRCVFLCIVENLYRCYKNFYGHVSVSARPIRLFLKQLPIFT
jgi:hypothetical protein